jgi:hypothetical protein
MVFTCPSCGNVIALNASDRAPLEGEILLHLNTCSETVGLGLAPAVIRMIAHRIADDIAPAHDLSKAKRES